WGDCESEGVGAAASAEYEECVVWVELCEQLIDGRVAGSGFVAVEAGFCVVRVADTGGAGVDVGEFEPARDRGDEALALVGNVAVEVGCDGFVPECALGELVAVGVSGAHDGGEGAEGVSARFAGDGDA